MSVRGKGTPPFEILRDLSDEQHLAVHNLTIGERLYSSIRDVLLANESLPHGPVVGGYETYATIAANSLERALRENRASWIDVHDAAASRVLASTYNLAVLRSNLLLSAAVSLAWIAKLDQGK